MDDRERTLIAPHSSYLPGLDGLRALAVVAVLLYHAGYPVVGGYLGVESFFVLSGFLITTLLVADWRRHGRVRLGAFWLRRARRLLPALVAMLAGTLLLSAALLPGELRPLGGDTFAALLYVMNWKLIAAQQSYFDALSRPSLLQHIWSLAIEEQFYLLWPLACALGLRLLRPAGLLVAALAVALGSSLLMVALYDSGADVSRIYYGTDTRASGLLIGAALALVWTHERRQALGPRQGAALAGGGRPGAGAHAGVLRLAARAVAPALPRRLPARRARHGGGDRRHHRACHAPAPGAARGPPAAVGRAPVVQPVPVALADLPAGAAGGGRAVGPLVGGSAALRADGGAGRSVLPLRRAAGSHPRVHRRVGAAPRHAPPGGAPVSDTGVGAGRRPGRAGGRPERHPGHLAVGARGLRPASPRNRRASPHDRAARRRGVGRARCDGGDARSRAALCPGACGRS